MTTEMSTLQTLLRFTLNTKQLFGFNVLKIREIVKYRRLNVIPGSHHGIAGTFELRGATVPVIDLSAAIGQSAIAPENLEHSTIIVAEFNRLVTGFLVRRVDKIALVDWQDIRELPQASGRNHYLTGVINIDDTLVSVLDVEKVLHEIAPSEVQADIRNALQPNQLAKISGCTILAVDDSSVARNLLSQTLDALDIKVIMATNGKEALTLLEQNQRVDMIISDIEMPEMDGYALTKEVRASAANANKYILLHSSLSGSASQGSVDEVGANALLTKFNADELAQAIYAGLTH